VPTFAAYPHAGGDANFPPSSTGGGEYDSGNPTAATLTEGTEDTDRYAEPATTEAATEAAAVAVEAEIVSGGADVAAWADGDDEGEEGDAERGRKRGREDEDEQ
jgi:hypothetical protein